jgi:hypothetical protein
MAFKVVMRTLTISAFVSLGVVGAAGPAAVANAAAVHADAYTVSTAYPKGSDGGAGNG